MVGDGFWLEIQRQFYQTAQLCEIIRIKVPIHSEKPFRQKTSLKVRMENKARCKKSFCKKFVARATKRVKDMMKGFRKTMKVSKKNAPKVKIPTNTLMKQGGLPIVILVAKEPFLKREILTSFRNRSPKCKRQLV